MVFDQNLQEWFRQKVEARAIDMVGGRARLKVIILLACILGLDSADKVTIGAIGGQLEQALHIGNIEIGLLVTASTGIGALATLPMGILVDRTNRVRLLVIGIIFWGIAMAISSAANSFFMLLLTRIGLGIVVAVATPAVASLTGDYFQPGMRGRIWGYILTGELVGAGFGLLISGEAAALFTWRASFWVLAVVSLLLAAAVWKWLPEPARGGQSHLSSEKKEIPSTEELQENGSGEKEDEDNDNEEEEDEVEEKVEEKGIQPRESMILKSNPTKMPFWQAVRYILSIRTNLFLIIASAFGYFFFTGLRTFAVIYMRGRFGLGEGTGKLIIFLVGLGAIIGVLLSGRTADNLIERGYISARITIGGGAFILTVILFLVGFLIGSMYIAIPLLFLAAAFLGGTNPPIDAARLDIMHSRLWGRAESVRTTLRFSFEAVAPISFGLVSSRLGASGGTFGVSAQSVHNGLALAHTFMIMLFPVIIAAIILISLFWGNNPYPRDVATALASERNTED
jgi:predicted MFS family arabinose efflux permease